MNLRARSDPVKAGFIPRNGRWLGETRLLVGGEGIEPPTSSV
jgi:hypothetical protein